MFFNSSDRIARSDDSFYIDTEQKFDRACAVKTALVVLSLFALLAGALIYFQGQQYLPSIFLTQMDCIIGGAVSCGVAVALNVAALIYHYCRAEDIEENISIELPKINRNELKVSIQVVEFEDGSLFFFMGKGTKIGSTIIDQFDNQYTNLIQTTGASQAATQSFAKVGMNAKDVQAIIGYYHPDTKQLQIRGLGGELQKQEKGSFLLISLQDELPSSQINIEVTKPISFFFEGKFCQLDPNAENAFI